MAENESSRIRDIYADTSTHGTVIADGYGITVSVRSGHLIINDGFGRARRERRIARMPRTMQRLVILSSTGTVTIEAQRWLKDAGIPWAVLDTETGTAITTSGPASTDARLLRAQSRACDGGELETTGREITRYLISEKLRGQISVISESFTAPDTETTITARLSDVTTAPTFTALSALEGQAAAAYWQTWSGRVHVPFSPDDLKRTPSHWWTFTQRPSLMTDYEKNSDATDPVNAVLNYLYRIAETECVHALHAVGLTPALGISHADKAGRDSLALDLIEAVRPVCDRIALQIFDTGLGIPYDQRTGRPVYFDRRWIHETPYGVVRLVPPLTHQLASHAADMGNAVRPHAYTIARMLADAADGAVTISRPKGVPRTGRVAVDHKSYPKARFRPGVTAASIIPDELWTKLAPLVPPRDPSKRGTKPLNSRDRTVALTARFILGVPWAQVPGGRSALSVQRWLSEWTGDGTWPKVRRVIEDHGHLEELTL